MPLVDLREHFGIWKRCGRTSFWREASRAENRKLLVNPVDGVMISAHDHPYAGGPALEVVVRDTGNIDDDDMAIAYGINYPWVKKALQNLFKGMSLIALTTSKKTPLSFFVEYYADQTEHFRETGEGHSDGTGKDEVLAATKKVLASLGDKAVVVRKVILRDEWDEFIESYGILEC